MGSSFQNLDDYCTLNPFDPLCSGFNNEGGYGGGGGVSTDITIVNVTGLSEADVNSIVDSSLNDLWDADVAGVDKVVADVVDEVQGAVTGLGNAIKAAWGALSHLFGDILKFLGTLWNSIIKGIIAALQEFGQLLKQLYDDVIVPALQALQRIRNWIVQAYQHFLRPVLVMLQSLRQVLAILRLFHLKFAAKLDTAIADIQSRITKPLFFLLSYTNQLANWINLIVTANYLLQQPLFLWSMKAYAGGAINLQVNSMNPPIDPAALAAAQQTNAAPTPAQSVASLDQYLTTRTGPFTEDLATYTPILDNFLSTGTAS